MALVDTGKAIGAVTKLLQDHLQDRTSLPVTVSRPEPSGSSGPKANLFLYEVAVDPHMRNVPLDEGQNPPLWLRLKYILTPFDEDGASDTIEAHENLGECLRAVQSMSFLELNAESEKALKDNPQDIKVTLDDSSSELLSSLMQGSDEKYRLSVGFDVGPIMIADAEPPSYSLLVGIDYDTSGSSAAEASMPIGIHVLPKLGASLKEVLPSKFEVGQTITFVGNDLDISGLQPRLGDSEMSIVGVPSSSQFDCEVTAELPDGTLMSAGSYPIKVEQELISGKKRSSNLVVGQLLPTLSRVLVSNVMSIMPTDPQADVTVEVVLSGVRLGSEEDDVFVALYRQGRTVAVFDEFVFVADQTSLELEITNQKAVPRGDYLVILRVNGQQAKNSPSISLVP
ncbi:MAG: Pvc16 family protein [Verrucomicrobiota bacterium]